MTSLSARPAVPLHFPPLLEGVEPEVVEEIRQSARLIHFSNRQQILTPGEKPDFIYIIRSGWVSVYHLGENGIETIINLLGRNDLLAQGLVAVNESSLLIGAQAKTGVEAISLPVGVINSHMQHTPQLTMNMLSIINRQSENVVHLLQQVITEPVHRKILRLFSRLMLDNDSETPRHEFILPLSKTDLAHYLGLSRETFSRTLKELPAYKVHVEGRKVRIEDPHTLLDLTSHPPCTEK